MNIYFLKLYHISGHISIVIFNKLQEIICIFCRYSADSELFALFNLRDHVEPSLVSAALVFCGNKDIGELAAEPRSDDPSAEAEHVRVVVQPCESYAERVGRASRADPVELVRRDRHSDAGSTAENSERRAAGEQIFAELRGVNRVIDALLGVAAEIDILYPLLVEVLLDLFLKRKSAVITGESNYLFQFCKFPFNFVLIFLHVLSPPERRGGRPDGAFCQ